MKKIRILKLHSKRDRNAEENSSWNKDEVEKTLITQVENSKECFAGINQVENRIYSLEDKVEELNHKANMKNKIHERNFKNPNIHMEAIKAPA